MLKNFSLVNMFFFLVPMWFFIFLNDLIMFWFLMEFMNVLFIVYYGSKKNMKMFSLYFFVVQSISGILLLFLFFLIDYKNLFFFYEFLLISLLFLKMGFIPFHFWSLKLIDLMNYEDLFVFNVLLKIFPLYLCYLLLTLSLILNILLAVNIFYSIVILFQYNSYKKIFFISSISNSMIFFVLMAINSFYSLIYMFIYFFFLFFFFEYVNKKNLIYVFSNKVFKDTKLFFLIFSFSGVPFSIGFLIKWFMFSEICISESFFFFFLLFFVSVIFSFFYMKILFMNFFFLKSFSLQNFSFFQMNFNSVMFIMLFFFVMPFFMIFKFSM